MFIGGAFIWFTGVVEDRMDPEEMNRVRVRCFGYHSEDSGLLPTEDLPWATVLMPNTSSGTSGIGDSPHALMEGSWVVGFFRDGESAQDPLIIGSIASFNSKDQAPKGSAFTGLDFPRGEYEGQSDVNKSARNNNFGQGTSMDIRASTTDPSPVSTASAPKISSVAPNKPASYYNNNSWAPLKPYNGALPTYPYNKVTESESGHVVEIDDTPGYERTLRMHASGSYEEIYQDGTRQIKILGDDYEVVLGAKNIHIKGNCNITCDGDMRQLVYGNYHLEVEGDYTQNIKGSLQTRINGNSEYEIGRSRSGNIGLNDNLLVNGDSIRNVVLDDLLTVSGSHVNNTAGNMSLVAYGNTSVFSGKKYSQTCIGDYAVASGGNALFGVAGTLTEDIDGSYNSTIGASMSLDVTGTYDLDGQTINLDSTNLSIDGTNGNITVRSIELATHTHPQTGGTSADSDAGVDVGAPSGVTGTGSE